MAGVHPGQLLQHLTGLTGIGLPVINHPQAIEGPCMIRVDPQQVLIDLNGLVVAAISLELPS